MLLDHLAREPGLLPMCPVRILHWQFRERRRLAGRVRLIESVEFARQDVQGPFVSNQSMESYDQNVILFEAQQASSHQRTVRQVERPPRFLCGDSQDFSRTLPI